MEWRLKQTLGFAEKNDPLADQIKRLVQYTGMGIGRRMLQRSYPTPGLVFSEGEDPLGDLIDLVKANPEEGLSAILQSGYLSLLLDQLPIRPGESLLYFDLMPDSLLIADRGNLEFQPRGVSQTIRALAAQLAQGECTKEKLIETVWGYRYDRLRHDSLIYPAISRFRQLLGSRAIWVEATDKGYRLNGRVKLLFHRTAEVPPQPVPVESREPSILDELNYRQLSLLQQIEKRESLDAQSCTKIFKISKVTASRDLSQLHRLALVKRVGKGRATRYFSLRKARMSLERA
jgi:hypothetical protein